MRKTLASVFVVGMFGCAHQSAQAPRVSQAVSSRAVPVVAEREPVPVEEYRLEARGLQRAQASPRTSPHHEDEVEALRTLARAVGALRDAPADSRLLIEAQADRIERSSVEADHHTAARIALREAVRALDASAAQHTDIPGWSSRVDDARLAVARIDARTPFLEQRPVIDRAFTRVAAAFPVGESMGSADLQRVAGRIPMQEVRVNRFLFNTIGKPATLTDECYGSTLTVEPHRTTADIATSLLTLGVYTPAHLSVGCTHLDRASR